MTPLNIPCSFCASPSLSHTDDLYSDKNSFSRIDMPIHTLSDATAATASMSLVSGTCISSLVQIIVGRSP